MTDGEAPMSDAAARATGMAVCFREGLLRVEPFIGMVAGDERYDDLLPGRSRRAGDRTANGWPARWGCFVNDHIAMPGHVRAYKLGQLEIARWRRDAERREGGGFSIRRFDDRILAWGSPPLETLRRDLADGEVG